MPLPATFLSWLEIAVSLWPQHQLVTRQQFHLDDTIRYDTRCYFNMRSKANMSQLNLPHGTDNYKV